MNQTILLAPYIVVVIAGVCLFFPKKTYDYHKLVQDQISVLNVFRGEIPTGDDILEQDDIVKLKRCIFSAQVLLAL